MPTTSPLPLGEFRGQNTHCGFLRRRIPGAFREVRAPWRGHKTDFLGVLDVGAARRVDSCHGTISESCGSRRVFAGAGEGLAAVPGRGGGGGRSRAIPPSRANGTAPRRERDSGSYRANVTPNRPARQAKPQGQTTGEISIVSPDISICVCGVRQPRD
jgi:hypothetical protein